MTSTENRPDYQRLKENLSNQVWRLNNLYWITDKSGKKVKFKLNLAQWMFLNAMWYLNVILKARQLGFSTFIDIFLLDVCLFNSNIKAGIIADNKDHARVLFEDKIKFAYDNLPEEIRRRRPARSESKHELVFNNGSSIRVGTSMRSGTLQYLHVSELGKISRKYPAKAKEIKTGSFNAVEAGQFIFVESTAEGNSGEFFDMCQASEKMALAKTKLTALDFKFHFFPWWKNPEYRLDPKDVVIHRPLVEYFAMLEKKHGIVLRPEQKAWYAKKKALLGEDIKQEFPSTPGEAFEVSIQGAYYATQFADIYASGRIKHVPYQPGRLVDTWWDIGVSDYTSIWFVQDFGTHIHVIDYYQNSGEGLPHYAKTLTERRESLGYLYGRYIGPHDLRVKDFGTGIVRTKAAQDLGIRFDIAAQIGLSDGIEAVRGLLPICTFDEEKCAEGIKGLENYRKEWDEARGSYRDQPLHDWASHPSDAFRYGAVGRKKRVRESSAAAESKPPPPRGGWT